jgi:hypothetical protein
MDLRIPHIVRLWTSGEILWEQAESENRDSQNPKGEIDLVCWFGGPHVTWSMRLRIAHGWRKEGRKRQQIGSIDQGNLSETTRSMITPN